MEEKEKKAKKAKSPDKTGKTLEEGEDGEKERREEITGLLDGEAYEYNFMLERIYKLLQTNHQELIESKKKFIHPPQVMKISGKRTAWINFQVYIYIYIYIYIYRKYVLCYTDSQITYFSL